MTDTQTALLARMRNEQATADATAREFLATLTEEELGESCTLASDWLRDADAEDHITSLAECAAETIG